ncbi:MAG: 50S ribosomal protein L24 [Candidatus Liptonbacteria bacterium]|nr:50S ribosomal protein L24 [Candidatus Liptonbacteria bacterium]
MHIKKGDKVQIRSGRDRGKIGTVIAVLPREGLVSVEGINLHKKRMRPRQQGKKGETVLIARPLHSSNVSLVCGSCKKAARIGYRVSNGEKARICKKCGAVT